MYSMIFPVAHLLAHLIDHLMAHLLAHISAHKARAKTFGNLTIEKWHDIQIFSPTNKAIPHSIRSPMASKPGSTCWFIR